MSNRIFKNYQVNMGTPFQMRTPLNFDTIKKAAEPGNEQDEGENPPETVKEAYEELLQRAKEDGELIIKEAKFEARKLMEDAEAEIQQNAWRTQEEARQKGYEEGMNSARQQYEDLIAEAEFVKENTKVEYREVLESVENNIIGMVLDIARKVIGAEISFNKEDVMYLVKQAIEKCTNKDHVVVKLCQEDYGYISQNKEQMMSLLQGVGELEFRKDNSLKAGACIVETPFGSLDASTETKLKKIEDAFRQVIGQ